MKEMRTKSIKIRFSEEELLQAKANCPRSEFARWLRELSLDSGSVNDVTQPANQPAKNSEIDLQFLRQITGIGNNINQIAKRVNSKYESIDSIDLLQQLNIIERQLQTIIEKF